MHVFFDVDGTIVPTELPHACFIFISALRSRWQRWHKSVVFWALLGPIILISKLFGEALAVRILAYITLVGVTAVDAEAASDALSDQMLKCSRPALLAELRRHQALGHPVTLLSGNLAPLVASFARKLGCGIAATECTVQNRAGVATYTGKLVGGPMVEERKAHHVASVADRGSRQGYGNSKSDIGFLSLVAQAFVVVPDSRLKRHAAKEGWSTKFAVVEEAAEFWALNKRFWWLTLGVRLTSTPPSRSPSPLAVQG